MDTQTKEMCGGRNSQSNGWIHKPRKCVEAETVSQTDGYTNQGNVWRQKQSVKWMDTQMCGGRNSQSNGWIHKPRKCVEAETVSQTDGYTNQGNVWRQKQSVKRMDTQMCGGRNSQSNGWIHKPRKCVEAETVSQTDGYTNQGNMWRQKQSVKRMDTQTKYPSLHVHAEGKQHREGGCACKLNPRHSLRECSTNWATRATQLVGFKIYNTIHNTGGK